MLEFEHYDRDYYQVKGCVSASLLKYWESDQRMFWDIFTGRKDFGPSSAAMILGQVVHTWFLEPEEFGKKCTMRNMPAVLTDKKKIMLDNLLSLESITSGKDKEPAISDIEEACRVAYSHTRKWSNSILNKYAMKKWLHEGVKDHFFSIINKDEGVFYTLQQKEMIGELERDARTNKIYKHIMEEGTTYSEKELFWQKRLNSERSIECKCKIDRVTYNEKEDVYYLIDIKTTELEPSAWLYSAKGRGYIQQLAFYRMALKDNFSFIAEKNIIPYIILMNVKEAHVDVVGVSNKELEYADGHITDMLLQIADSKAKDWTTRTRRYYGAMGEQYRADYWLGWDDQYNPDSRALPSVFSTDEPDRIPENFFNY